MTELHLTSRPAVNDIAEKTVQNTVKIHLLGSFTILVNGELILLPKTKDAQRVLSYLLLHPHQAHLRSFLAGLFWPDSPEAHARRQLTRALGQIRGQPWLASLLHADVNTIMFVPSDDVWIDYHAFHRLVTPHLHNNVSSNVSSAAAANELSEAVQLYQGHLLPGLYDDWLFSAQRRTEELCQTALTLLINICKSRGQYQTALNHALRLGQMDRLNEAHQREIMRLYTALAQPQAAREQYRTYRQYLWSEMGVAPEAETDALFQQLGQRTTANPARQTHDQAAYLPQQPQPLPPLVSGQRSDLPLVGRETERQQLLTHLNTLFDDELAMGGIILVEGEAGVGKTRLVQGVVQDLAWRGAQVVWHDAAVDAPNLPYAPYVKVLELGLTELQTRQVAHLVEPQWLQDLCYLLPCVQQWLPDFQPAAELDNLHLEQLRFVEAYAQILISWSQLAPLILVFDNLDGWTADCLHVLSLLMHRVMEAPLVFIGLYQTDAARQQPVIWQHIQQLASLHLFTHMTVTPLTAQATTALVRTALATVTPMPRLEARLHREAAGNPLFILELLHALYQKDLLRYHADDGWHSPLEEASAAAVDLPFPVALKSLFLERHARLSVEEKSILNCAVIWGLRFDLTRVFQLAMLPEQKVLAVLAHFEQSGIIEASTPGYLFRQDLFRQTVYAAMESKIRVALHRRVLHLLTQEAATTKTTLLHHAVCGALWVEAVSYAMQAAAEAREIYAYATAHLHLAQADDLLLTHTPFDSDQQAQLQAEIHAAQQLLLSALSSAAEQTQAQVESHAKPVPILAVSVLEEGVKTLTVELAKTSAPAFGRALRDDEKQTVVWTLHQPADATIQGKKPLRHHRLLRLIKEAQAQDATPTIEELASALQVNDKTIHRDLQQLRQQGARLPTRGSRTE